MKLLRRKPAPITRELIPAEQRLPLIEKLLGIPIRIEIVIQGIARRMTGGYVFTSWVCFRLSNGGLYFAPAINRMYPVVCDNQWRGTLSADALGCAASLIALNQQSFSGRPNYDERCYEVYFLVREYAVSHAEAENIKQAIA